MFNKPILIVPGQSKSIFFEIFFKSLKKKYRSPLILICNKENFLMNAKKFDFKKKINVTNFKELEKSIHKYKINIVNIEKSKRYTNHLNKEKDYIFRCFKAAFNILKKNITYKFLNGPINKKKFLNGKYIGITEFISKKFHQKNTGMLIYNENLSVCPLTTHLPIKLVSKNISKNLIQNKLKLINDFYLKIFKFKPKIAVVGLNPHCESVFKFNEDIKIVTPAINYAKKNKILVYGPFSADTIFLKQNRKKFNVILGMYHDQVLSPLKTLFEYDAVNITMGLPFLRVSPDHGPNEEMINKNISNPVSLIKCLEFLDKN